MLSSSTILFIGIPFGYCKAGISSLPFLAAINQIGRSDAEFESNLMLKRVGTFQVLMVEFWWEMS